MPGATRAARYGANTKRTAASALIDTKKTRSVLLRNPALPPPFASKRDNTGRSA